MESNTKLPKKHFYLIIIACSLIIFCESVQVLIYGKSMEYYNLWLENIQFEGDINLYITMLLSSFFMSITVPIMLGIYSYIAFFKIRIGKLFVFIWTVLMLGSFTNTIITWDFTSVFYYMKIVGYFVGIITILALIPIIKQNTNIRGEYNV